MDFAQARIWALLDERQGNTNQTLGVAEALGVPFETRRIEFNNLVRIPNLFINHTKIWAGQSGKLLEPPWPDIVISTARRLGIAASYIKYRNPKSFAAQIQWPGLPASQFDLIAAPKHDNVKMAKNIFITAGAPHRVTLDKLKHEAELWRPKVAILSSPRIAVLVGGDGNSRKFSDARAKELAVLASKLAQSLSGSLMVTTSRRTSQSATDVLAQSITAPHYFYRWDDAKAATDNPFYGFLGLADAVIATGDSISMCSEACATGKPVYVYALPEFVSPKHQQFIDELIAQGLIKPLREGKNALFSPSYRLDDSLAIAQEIKKRYLQHII